LQHHNAAGINPVDVTRVGDPPDLPLGTADPDLLLWSEREGRVLVTLDEHTIPGYLAAHLQQGHHSPGVFFLKTRYTLAQLAFELVLAAYVYDPADVADQVRFVP
jgi:hypothetical protein